MKRTLLPVVTIALLAMVFFSCENDNDYHVTGDYTIKPDGAPAVDAGKIKAEALLGGVVLVSWQPSEQAGGYQVWRREINASNEVVKGSEVQLTANQGKTANKQLPYLSDSSTTAGTKYQYGIVSTTYKSGGSVTQISDIVWQQVDNNAYVTIASKDEAGKILSNPKTPTVELKTLTSSTPANIPNGQTPTPNILNIVVSGLEYGYNYSMSLQYSTDNGTTWQAVPFNTNFSINSQLSGSISTYATQKLENNNNKELVTTTGFYNFLTSINGLNLGNTYTANGSKQLRVVFTYGIIAPLNSKYTVDSSPVTTPAGIFQKNQEVAAKLTF